MFVDGDTAEVVLVTMSAAVRCRSWSQLSLKVELKQWSPHAGSYFTFLLPWSLGWAELEIVYPTAAIVQPCLTLHHPPTAVIAIASDCGLVIACDSECRDDVELCRK